MLPEKKVRTTGFDFRSKSINWRIRYIRKDLKLSQDIFADSLGVGQTTISNMEREGTKVKSSSLQLICQVYHVNYIWLSKGFGDPYLKPKIIAKEAVEKYNLDAQDQEFIENFVKLNKESRNLIRNLLSRAFEKASD